MNRYATQWLWKTSAQLFFLGVVDSTDPSTRSNKVSIMLQLSGFACRYRPVYFLSMPYSRGGRALVESNHIQNVTEIKTYTEEKVRKDMRRES